MIIVTNRLSLPLLMRYQDASNPYLNAMIQHSRIGSKVWYSGLGLDSATDNKRDEIGYLDYQVLQWQKNLPEQLQFHPAQAGQAVEGETRAHRRLRVLLYIRANQMRILIYRPVLHSATSIMENRAKAQTVVDVAKDTIIVLTRLNQATDIYRSQQVCFNYFLLSALAVLFLAVSHAPAEFNRHVHDEFYMALALVKGLSMKSYTSKRLWKMIRGLREIGEKLGLLSRPPAGPDQNDAHSTAAMAMAGLAGHPVENMPMYAQTQGFPDLATSPVNGVQISNELTNLFEAAGGYGNFMAHQPGDADGLNGFGGDVQGGEGLPTMFGNEEEFSRVMGGLF